MTFCGKLINENLDYNHQQPYSCRMSFYRNRYLELFLDLTMEMSSLPPAYVKLDEEYKFSHITQEMKSQLVFISHEIAYMYILSYTYTYTPILPVIYQTKLEQSIIPPLPPNFVTKP